MGAITYTPNTYAGELYNDIAVPALMAPDGLIEKGLVTPVPGLKSRRILRDLANNEVEFQDPSCTFEPQLDSPDISEKYLDPIAYEVMREICFKDVKSSWDVMKLKAGELEDYVPPKDLEGALIEGMEQKIQIMNEQMYLNGKGYVSAGLVTITAAYPGLFGRFRADANVIKFATGTIGGTVVSSIALTGITIAAPGIVTVASTANLRTGDTVTIIGTNNAPLVNGKTINGQDFKITVINATTFSLNKQVTGTAPTSGTVVYVNETNVIEVLLAATAFLPDTVKDAPDFKIVVPKHIQRAYAIAQARVANGAGSWFVGTKDDLDFLGDKLIPLAYIPANTIAGWQKTNVFLGYDDGGDDVDLRIIDMSKTTGDKSFRYFLGMQTDINFRFGQEIFYMAPVIV